MSVLDTQRGRDVLEYLEAPLRRPYHVLIPMVAITVASVVISFALPKRYRSSTLILVESEKVPDSFVPKMTTESTHKRLFTIKQEILSRTRLERVLKDTDPYPEQVGRQPLTSIVENMRNNATINVKGNDAFTIEYVHKDPQKAMAVADRLATLFIEESTQERTEQVQGAYQFIESELAEARKELEGKEENLRRYKERHMGALPEQTSANLATLERVQNEVTSTNNNLRAARERMSLLEKSLADQFRGSGVGSGDPSAELKQLRSELATLRGRYTDEHPDVKLLLNRIARLEHAIGDGGASDPATASLRSQLEKAQLEVDALQTKRDDLENRIALFQGRVEHAPRIEQELATLKRDYEKINENYLALLKKKMDAQMAEKLEERWKGEHFRILDPAFLPERPFFPDKRLFLMMGIFLGLLAGVGLALAVETVDHSIKSVADLETALPYPVLAVFPHIARPEGGSSPASGPRYA